MPFAFLCEVQLLVSGDLLSWKQPPGIDNPEISFGPFAAQGRLTRRNSRRVKATVGGVTGQGGREPHCDPPQKPLKPHGLMRSSPVALARLRSTRYPFANQARARGAG